MSPRVLYVIGSGRVGGRERQLATLVPAVVHRGWHPGVVFMSVGGPVADALGAADVPTWLPDDITRRHQPPRWLATPAAMMRTLTAMRTIRRAARQHHADVVHLMLPTSVWLGHLALVATRTRTIAGVYGFTPTQSRIIATAYRRALRRCSAVVCNAPHLAEEMVARFGVDRARVMVVPNGVDLPEVVADVGRVGVPTAVTVANFHAYKGYDVLADAIGRVAEPVRYRWCGTGEERSPIEARLASTSARDTVTLVEPPADVPAELLGAQFAVHPSRTEGLSNAILEQLAHGLPVIACEVGGNPTLIEHGVNGLLVPPGDAIALAAAIETLASDPALRVRMGAAARATAERYSWDACTEAHLDLYGRLAATPQRRRRRGSR